MIFNPGLFQAPDFFRFNGHGDGKNESACPGPIGPGQKRHLIQSYAKLRYSILFFPRANKKRRGFTLSFSILNVLPQCQKHSQYTSQL
jgi:hypothetical protein